MTEKQRSEWKKREFGRHYGASSLTSEKMAAACSVSSEEAQRLQREYKKQWPEAAAFFQK